MKRNKKYLPVRKELPKEFNLQVYDTCESWKASEWYNGLMRRSKLIEYMHDSRLPIPNNLSLTEVINELLLDPLRHDESVSIPKLSPVQDQSIAEFFSPFDLVLEDDNYAQWHKHVVLANEAVEDQEFHNKLVKHISQPSWVMHRECTPAIVDPMRFLISVDIRAPDEMLDSKFMQWVKEIRKEINRNKKHILSTATSNELDFQEWHNYRYLPYLDLKIWSSVNLCRFTPETYNTALFPEDDHKALKLSNDTIRKTLSEKAENLFSTGLMAALMYKAQEEQAKQKLPQSPLSQ